MYIRFTAFWNFSKFLFVLHTLAFIRNFYSGDAHHANYGKQRLDHHFRNCAQCIWDLKCFQTFRYCCLFYTFWLLRNFYSGDAHHSNYCELCLNHHSFHCSHCVIKIYSVFKPFEIAVCFGTFGFYEISTPVMLIMLTMANIVKIIISDIAHTVYIRFTVFSNFSNLQFVLHILVFTKFLLRWCPPC